MSATAYHPEDIKAELRKRYGTVGAFARTHDLKPQAVADFLRGRTSGGVAKAIAAELEVSGVEVQSIRMDNNDSEPSAHRLSAGGR